MKLSKTQLEVLKELGQEGNFIHCTQSRLDVGFFFHGSMKTVKCNTIWALEDKGLVIDKDYDDFLKRKIYISDAGKKFLSELA